MRVEYGSVEKDGSPDLDVDWLADGWIVVAAQVVGRRRARGRLRAERHGDRHRGRSGKAGHPHRVVQERGRNRHHVLHQLRLRQGRATGRHAVRVGHVPVVRARPPGTRPGRGDQGVAGGHRRLLVQAAARLATRGVGVAPVTADRARAPRCWNSWPTSPSGSQTSTPCRCRRTGAATSSHPRSSSSGRAGRTGCTTEFASTGARVERLQP